MGWVNRFLNYLTGRTEIRDLAKQLHLPRLPDYVEADKPQWMLTTVGSKYTVNYTPCNAVESTNPLFGLPRQSLKKAFEVSVLSRDTGQDSVSVIYREDAPGYYTVDSLRLNADCCHLKIMRDEKDCTVQAIMKVVERYAPPQRCEF